MPTHKKFPKSLKLKKRSFSQLLIVGALIMVLLTVVLISYFIQSSNLSTGSKAATPETRSTLGGCYVVEKNVTIPSGYLFCNKIITNGKVQYDILRCNSVDGKLYPETIEQDSQQIRQGIDKQGKDTFDPGIDKQGQDSPDQGIVKQGSTVSCKWDEYCTTDKLIGTSIEELCVKRYK